MGKRTFKSFLSVMISVLMAGTLINPFVLADDGQVTDEEEPIAEVASEQEEETPEVVTTDGEEAEGSVADQETADPQTTEESDEAEPVPAEPAEAVINEEVPAEPAPETPAAETAPAEEEASDEAENETEEETAANPDVTPAPAEETADADEEVSYPAFSQSAVLGNVTIRVSAGEDTFPEGSSLSVRHVVRTSEIAAVDAVIDTDNTNTDTTYYFDIKVLDSEGNEIQPANGNNVSISFTTPKAADPALEAEVVHVREDGSAEELSVSTAGSTLNVVSDGFSVYAVSFHYVDGETVPDEIQVYTLALDSEQIGRLSLRDLFTLASVEAPADDTEVSVLSSKDYVTVGFVGDETHTFANAYLNVKEEFDNETVTIKVHAGGKEYVFNLTGSEENIWNRLTVHFEPNTAGLDPKPVPTGSMDDQTYAWAETKRLSTNGFICTGYTLTGWNTQPDGEGTGFSPSAFTTYTALNDLREGDAVVTLYAQWEEKTYTLYFWNNGGSGSISSYYYPHFTFPIRQF